MGVLINMYLNSKLDVTPNVSWNSDHVSINGSKVYYNDAKEVSFIYSTYKHYTNFVKNQDEIGYVICINGHSFGRKNHATFRLSSDSRDAKNSIINEYQRHMTQTTEKIMPVIMAKKVREIMTTGSANVGGATLTSDKKIKYDGYTNSIYDIKFATDSGYIKIWQEGKRKPIYNKSTGETNACLLIPILKCL